MLVNIIYPQMKEYKELLQQSLDISGFSRISNHHDDSETARTSFSEYLNTQRSMMTEMDESFEKKKTKITHQLSILERKVLNNREDRSNNAQRIKYKKYPSSGKAEKQITITSRQLQEIRKFDHQLYQSYLNLYHGYQLQMKEKQNLDRTLDQLTKKLNSQKNKEKDLNKDLQNANTRINRIQSTMKKSEAVWIKSIRQKVQADFYH